MFSTVEKVLFLQLDAPLSQDVLQRPLVQQLDQTVVLLQLDAPLVLDLRTADADVVEGRDLTFVGVGVAEGCLLYTSPSPRDGLLSRMPSSA